MSFVPGIDQVSKPANYPMHSLTQTIPSVMGLNPTCPFSPNGIPSFYCFGSPTGVLTLCLSEIKRDWIWERRIHQNRFQSHQYQVTTAKQGLLKMVDTMVDIHSTIVGRKSHRSSEIIKIQMLADCVQTMKTATHPDHCKTLLLVFSHRWIYLIAWEP